MRILPKPKKLKIKDGFLKNKAIHTKNEVKDDRLLNALRAFEVSESGVSLQIIMGAYEESEKYTLAIDEESITIEADGSRGAFYAIQTLKQIFTEDKVPCLFVEDEPDFKYRGFYHDVTRGKVPTVATIKKLIDDMVYYKLNSLQLYVEHTFEFKEFTDSIERTGYLTGAELRELDDYCKMNFVDFIPSIATFGHLYELLEKDEFKHLREIENFEQTLLWSDRMAHHTIDPTKEESFELIKSLIDQYMVNFSSDKFNICGDETFDLKTGKHKDEDTGKLYIDFVTKIINYIQCKGKTVMMWADILLNHPEQIDNLPEDVVLLNWYYWDKSDENSFKILQNSKRTQIVCPGTGSWSRFCEDYDMDIININKMVDFGYKYGAEGVLNTNWGDWGNPCSIELAMFGLVLGAAKSWNVATDVDEDYIKSVNRILYAKENANEYVKKISKLSGDIQMGTLVKYCANITEGREVFNNIEYPAEETLKRVVCDSLNLINDVENATWEKENYKEQILLAAEALAVMAEMVCICAGYDIDRKTDTKKFVERYSRKWLEDNKESELRKIENVFLCIDNYFSKQ